MRYGRIRQADGSILPVVIDGETAFAMEGELTASPAKGAAIGQIDSLTLTSPLEPGKIVCVGLNYLAHVTENDPTRPVPEEPVLFMKPTSAIVGPGDPIRIVNPGNRTDYEAELAVVVGKTMTSVAEQDVLDHLFGFTCANDVSDRVLQKKDGQWVRAKGFDTYCPLGPWIETDLDLSSAVVSSALNGEPRQSQGVATMLFPVPVLLSFISNVMTLLPGDVVLTGTPEGVGPLTAGDTIEVTVSGIGTLSNPVVNR
ncbi:MAG: fumarylacetoacetate hydrolase family protein [Thermomicrobiales bacterium]|nr:fumarylacetoacetate hydrolase family protein [Thermomicrobiales bacterium]